VVAVRSAGAYGAVMASTYNTRPLVPEVLVDGDRHEVIRPRQSLDDLIGADRVPAWL
jgi:diaminopimelate decarboxylase